MSLEDNKGVVREFFDRLSRGDVKGALDLLTDDATWWIAGKSDAVPSAGTLTKEQLGDLFRRMGSRLEGGLTMTVKGLTAEGERVAVEAESYGKLKNGRVYNQQYHMLMEIEGGQIRAVREYLDTQHVLAVWFAE